jgi:hypothetical protein
VIRTAIANLLRNIKNHHILLNQPWMH